MKTETDALWQLLAAPALLAVPFRYGLDWFDGVRKEKHGTKGLAFVCWYGLQRRPHRLPRWMNFIASKIRTHLLQQGQRTPQAGAPTKTAIAFVFNSGRIPLKVDDLFQSKPLKLMLTGDGQLTRVNVRFESDQTAGVRLTGERRFLRRPQNHLTERALTFAYLAPGHGLVLEIVYTAHEPVTFSLSGPVNGMKSSIQQQRLYEIDIVNSRRRQRQRRAETWSLWIGSLMMAGAVVKTAVDLIHGGHAAASADWTFWVTIFVMGAGEWLALSAWYRVKQVRKIPTALRFWESSPNARFVSAADRTSIQ